MSSFTSPSSEANARRTRLLRAPQRDHDIADARAASLLPEAGFAEARATISGWPDYAPTPLVRLHGLAAELGVAQVWVKDESERFGLGSFKALGGAYAVATLARSAEDPSTLTVTSATDGNHGRSVAWGARTAGCRCVIYLHEGVSEARESAIAQYGAQIVRTPGNYDDSAHRCAVDAAANGWELVSDTTPSDDVGCALDVMQGYRLLVDEALEQLDGEWPTHVFVQGGCGGLAAAVRAHLGSARDGREHPVFVVVEPEEADCLYRSAEAGRPVVVHGALDTVMAGLAVGEVSRPAWELLERGTDVFQAIPDDAALDAMRRLASGAASDASVVSGETGAAGIAGLVAGARGDGRATLGLDAGSRVLVINTEGDTDPELYERIVGESAGAIRGRTSNGTTEEDL